MLCTTQWTHVIFGARGSGASGSSTMSAKLRVPCGAPDQLRGGDMSAPSQVYCFGIALVVGKGGRAYCEGHGQVLRGLISRCRSRIPSYSSDTSPESASRRMHARTGT